MESVKESAKVILRNDGILLTNMVKLKNTVRNENLLILRRKYHGTKI